MSLCARQKIASLQSHILELESELEAAGVTPSSSSPSSEIDRGPSAPRSSEHHPPVSQSSQTEPVGVEDAETQEAASGGRCPTCGHVSESAEGGDVVEMGVQTETSDLKAQCSACGAAMAAEGAKEEGRDDGESRDKPDVESRLEVGDKIDPETSHDISKAKSGPEPGDLSSEIARLASIQQQLQQSPPPLAKQTSLPANLQQSSPSSPTSLTCIGVQTEYSHDQLNLELRELTEKYNHLKKSCDALEEQKNELEEAENDARLMVQR